MLTDIQLPNISEDDLKSGKGIRRVMEYMYTLTEQLRFMLNNVSIESLDSDFTARIESVMKASAEAVQSASGKLGKNDVIRAINNSQEQLRILQTRMDMTGITMDADLEQKVNDIVGNMRILFSQISSVDPEKSLFHVTEDEKLNMPDLEVLDENIKSVNASKLIDKIIHEQLANASVGTDQIQAGAIVADLLAAKCVLSTAIAAGAIKAEAVDFDSLWASEANIGKIKAAYLEARAGQDLNLQSNEAIQLLIQRTVQNENSLNDYISSIAAYMRFSAEHGLELGKAGEPYITRTDNDSYAILKDGEVIMEVRQDEMFIPNITSYRRITMGDDANGKYILGVSPTHLTLRCS